MKGDFSRLTWNPAKRYDSVRMQQGRVQLDADWNEQVDIDTHLREQALADLIGRCCTPEGAAGFEIATAGSDLSISEGRLYVDGILCEQLDPALSYLAQPDYPGTALPEGAGTFLVYLDVWKWHVTALEDPGILETALGGRDTTTRLKTVCQVRLQQVEDGSECRDVSVDVPDHAGLAARSQPEDDPDSVCIVPASAGYTRLENYLYRIEVHEGGQLGVDTPSFKWSRNNASIVTEWLGQEVTNPNRLMVRSTGRDELLGFHDARWVELTDDDRELRGESGLLVEVLFVEDDVIEIDPGAFTIDIADFGTHPKVRRWDMDTDTGAIPIEIAADNDGYLRIESGVEILFEAGEFVAGRYWLIPARAFIGEFQGDIEWPVDPATSLPEVQPPHGVAHHYCKLALVSFDGTAFTFEEDCRHSFNGLCALEEGCCTVVVEPGENIQEAIDSLPPEGGCVCLKSGEHRIDETIRIDRSDVVLKGESAGARVTGNVLPLLEIGVLAPRAQRIDVDQIRFEADVEVEIVAEPAVIALRSCDAVRLRRLGMRSETDGISGVTIWDTDDIGIERCRIEARANGIWVTEDSFRLRAAENRIEAPSDANGGDGGLVGIFAEMAFSPCTIISNEISGFAVGVALTRDPFGGPGISSAHGSLVFRNRILRGLAATTDDAARLFGIDVAASDCRIAENQIEFASALYGGIRSTGSRNVLADNRIVSGFGDAQSTEQPVGILVGDAAAGPVSETRVQANRLDGLQDGIVVRNAARIVVAGNDIGAPSGEVRTGILFDAVSESRAEGNRISDARTAVNFVDGSGNRIGGNEVSRGGVGLLVDSDDWIEIDGNRLRETGQVPIQIGFWQGTARLHHNRCEYCGHGLPQLTAAVFAYVGLGELQIEHCELHHTGVSPEDGSVAQAIFGVLGLLILQASLQSNNIAAAVGDAGANALQGQHRAVYLLGFMDLQISDLVDLGFPAQLLDNRFTGLGDFPVVEIAGFPVNDVFNMRFNRVQYSDNFCWHLNRQTQTGASVVIASATASAMGNHFKWLQRITPIDFGATNALYMGNAADGVFAQGTSILPSPQNAFNR